MRLQLVEALEHLTLRLQTGGGVFGPARALYQPLPWIGLMEAKRGSGSTGRLESICSELKQHGIHEGVVLDIGCNVGFFSLSLAERGFFCYGVDSSAKDLKIAQLVSRLIDGGVFNPIRLHLDEQSIEYLPAADVTLFLSIWHHWVRDRGMDGATQMLQQLFAKTRRVLFFESGQSEATEEYQLPFKGEEAALWLGDYLRYSLPNAQIVGLGEHQAIGPAAGGRERQWRRALFAVFKRSVDGAAVPVEVRH